MRPNPLQGLLQGFPTQSSAAYDPFSLETVFLHCSEVTVRNNGNRLHIYRRVYCTASAVRPQIRIARRGPVPLLWSPPIGRHKV